VVVTPPHELEGEEEVDTNDVEDDRSGNWAIDVVLYPSAEYTVERSKAAATVTKTIFGYEVIVTFYTTAVTVMSWHGDA
jgi:hypothetical protein